MNEVPGSSRLTIELNPKRIATTLFFFAGGLAAAHTSLWVLSKIFPEQDLSIAWRFFHLSREGNLPTYFSALILLIASLLLYVIWFHKRRQNDWLQRRWLVLSVGMLLMSVDEAASIHEGVVGAVLEAWLPPLEGIWSYIWYIPYIPVVILVILWYIPFLRELPARTSLQFTAAGALYLGGVLGMEMVAAYINYHNLPGQTPQWIVEESLEMIGIVVFIYALLVFLAVENIQLSVRARTSAAEAVRNDTDREL